MALTTNVPSAIPQVTSHVVNGFTTDIQGVQFPLQMGVPLQNMYMFKVVPAAFSSTCVAQLQVVTPNLPLTFNQDPQGTAPNIITQPLSIENANFGEQIGIELDCERCVTISCASPSTSNVNVTVKGLDYLGNAITGTIVLAINTSSIVFLNPLSIVAEVTLDADPGSEVSVGNSNDIGLPYYLYNDQFFIKGSFGTDVLITQDITLAYNWRLNNPSITQYPNRGTINTYNLPDGVKMLVCTYYVMGSDGEINAEINNINQSSKKIVSVQNNTSGNAVLPYITPYDLKGVVYPEDLVFINKYISAKLN